MPSAFPHIEPYDSGMLDVGDGTQVYWEQCGNPEGKPALVVHGGPGSGCSAGQRRSLDPGVYRVVLFDQRGCGRSLPHASDPATDMSVNTTEHLLRDMEYLRKSLGIEQWLLFGASWGSTLSLAYAQRYPDRVSEIVLVDVTTSSRAEIDWLYRGVARFFPEAWERFRLGVPESDRDGNLVAAYAKLMENPEQSVRQQAAADWCTWEDAVLSLEQHGTPNQYASRPDDARIAFVRICAHYVSHEAWLEDEQLLKSAGALEGIPAVLVHGRQDMSAPPDTAWKLAQLWCSARLHIVDDAGHKGNEYVQQLLNEAFDTFGSPNVSLSVEDT